MKKKITSNIFKTSVIISVSLHLLVFILISPEINPRDFSYASFPKVNFFNASFSQLQEERESPYLNKINPTLDFFKRKIARLNILPQVVGLKPVEMSQGENYTESSPSLTRIEFSLPVYENLEIEGELRKRLLISKPQAPKIPAWFNEKINGPLAVKICVDGKGDVVFCRKAISSGSYTLDIIGLDYVRSFKFAPSQKSFQEGTVEVSFKEQNV